MTDGHDWLPELNICEEDRLYRCLLVACKDFNLTSLLCRHNERRLLTPIVLAIKASGTSPQLHRRFLYHIIECDCIYEALF